MSVLRERPRIPRKLTEAPASPKTCPLRAKTVDEIAARLHRGETTHTHTSRPTPKEPSWEAVAIAELEAKEIEEAQRRRADTIQRRKTSL